MKLFLSVAVMAGVTYLIRMIPLTLCRKQIRSRFLRSLLFYLPYAVLSAMTIPAIFYSTGSLPTAIVGTAAALILAYCRLPLIAVALAAAAAALVTGFFL